MKIKDFTSIYEGKFSLENVENGKGFYLFENLEVVNFTKEMGNSIIFKTKYHVKDFITLYANEILKLLSF